jgi:hypothetical protein
MPTSLRPTYIGLGDALLTGNAAGRLRPRGAAGRRCGHVGRVRLVLGGGYCTSFECLQAGGDWMARIGSCDHGSPRSGLSAIVPPSKPANAASLGATNTDSGDRARKNARSRYPTCHIAHTPDTGVIVTKVSTRLFVHDGTQ